MYVFIFLIKVTEWPPIGIRYVSWYKCLIVSLVFSHLGFWSGNLFLIAPFPDLCLLVPFSIWCARILFLAAFWNEMSFNGFSPQLNNLVN